MKNEYDDAYAYDHDHDHHPHDQPMCIVNTQQDTQHKQESNSSSNNT